MTVGLRFRYAVVLVVLAALAILAIALFGPARQGEPGSGTSLVARFVEPGLAPDEAAGAIRRRTISPEFESPLPLTHNSRQVLASGPLSCDPGELWRVDVVIVQDGVRAEGHTQGHCGGGIGTWSLKAVVRGPVELEPGEALGTAAVTTRKGGRVTDRFDWTQGLVLEAQ